MRKFRTVSIIIPVFNEEKTILQIIKRVFATKVFGLKKEIIVVNDGSTDGTLQKLKTISGINLITSPKNSGKGKSVRLGFAKATGDILLIQDADLEYDPSDYQELLAPIIEGKADVVYGSRLMTTKPHRVLFFWHYMANLFFTTLSNMFSNLNLTDMETGYKVFTKDVVQKLLPRLESNRFGFEPEVTARVGSLAKLEGCRVFEVGVSYYGRTYKEGKKIGLKDAAETLFCILKYNFLSSFFRG